MKTVRRNVVTAAVTLTVAFTNGSSFSAKPTKPIRYGSRQEQTIAYKVDVTTDLGGKVDTMSGVISYTFKSSEEDTLQVTSKGGLKKTQKAKSSKKSSTGRPTGRPIRRGPSRGPIRRGGPSRRGPRGPFGSTQFRGLTTSTNQLSVNSRGVIQSMKGDSQLPYLLGNLSLLIFEPLPEQAQESWTVSSGITITEKNERRTGPPIFARPPFNRQPQEKRTSGSESTSFKIESDDGKLVVANKTYQLQSPQSEETSFSISGNGKWTFNRETGFPEKLDYKQKLTVQVKNVTVSFPMTIKYARMTDEELAAHEKKMEAEKAKRQAALQELKNKKSKKSAAGLTADEKKTILEKLKSKKFADVARTLQSLLRKSPETPDQDIAKAVADLFEHKNRGVQNLIKSQA